MILDKILKQKRKEINALRRSKPMPVLKREARALPKKKPFFLAALKKAGPVAVIAEIKQRSPSRGILRDHFHPAELARELERGGASALSVLTDEKFFAGSAAVLREVKSATHLPILRKDFILDAAQLFESRFMGADAVLLIAAVLSRKKLRALDALARSLGLDVLFEVHSAADTRKVLALKPRLVGINNRDLRTFRVDIRTTGRLAGKFRKNTLLVSESGIQNCKDLIYLRKFGVRAVLVGESLMRAKNPGAALRKLRGR